MRLFIAFDISAEAKEELARLQEGLKGPAADMTLAKGFHLTLKFLGEVADSRVDELKKRLAAIKFTQFEAGISGAGAFPNEEHARVVWAGLEPHDTIASLQQQVEKSLEGMFPKDERFHPHITLARVKSIKDKKGFTDTIKKAKPKSISFKVSSFSLLKSTLTPQGPVYENLASFKALDL